MVNMVLFLVISAPFLVALFLVFDSDNFDEKTKMSMIDRLVIGYVVLLLLVLSVGRALADDRTDRQRISQDVFSHKFSAFLEKGTFNIDGKVILNSGFTQTVNYPPQTAIAIISVTHHKTPTVFNEATRKYETIQMNTRVSYLVLSRNGIKINKAAKGMDTFIYDNSNNPLKFVNKLRTEITDSTPDGIYAFATSASTVFKEDDFWDKAFTIDPLGRLEYNARWLRINNPTPVDGDSRFRNDRPFVEGKGYKWEVDYQYNAKFVDGLDGKELTNEKALFDVEVDKIISEENAKKHLQDVEGDSQKDKNDSINQDNFGKKGKELEENYKNHKGNSFVDWLEYFVYDEKEVKKAIVSTISKIDSMKHDTEVFNGSTFNPANNASYGIWNQTIKGLDGANFDENHLTGATSLGIGRENWRNILKYTIRMIGSFALLTYAMKIKERIVSK